MDSRYSRTVRRARAYDRTEDGPVTSHLAAIDVLATHPDWDQLAAVDAAEAV